MFRAGQQIGNYTLINRIGRGGFGEVWLAERRAKFVTTKVAVKLPHDEQVDHAAIKQEATLWEQASGHANILPILDADEYDGQIVIVSEYAPDGSLEEWLNKNGKMTFERAAELTVEILAGLEFLHARKIIHRDLKPANILLQGNTPRLTDFGISRALRTTIASQSQFISGTFAYMSPEALDGKRSVQTDIWAVGVNLYRFLTGSLPFPQKEPSILFPAIIMREYEPLPNSVPDALRQIVARALAKQPADRYQTAAEMRKDLVRFLRRDAEPSPSHAPSPLHVAVNTACVATDLKVPVANETETAVRPVLPVKSVEKRDDAPQVANSSDAVKPRKLEIELPESTRQRVKRLLILTETTPALWGPMLLWSAVGLISGFLCWLTWQPTIGVFAPGVVFGFTAYCFAEYSSSPLIRRRRRLLAIPLVIVLSAIGFYLAFIAFLISDSLGWGYFIWGVVWSTFLGGITLLAL
jgi:serine/threonine protein kinase